VPVEAAPPVCLVALALLFYSFGADVVWLAGHGNARTELR